MKSHDNSVNFLGEKVHIGSTIIISDGHRMFAPVTEREQPQKLQLLQVWRVPGALVSAAETVIQPAWGQMLRVLAVLDRALAAQALHRPLLPHLHHLLRAALGVDSVAPEYCQ